MSKLNEKLREHFIKRYNQLKASELLLDAAINLLYSINSEEGYTIGIEEFISKIPEYNAYNEDVISVKQILQQVNTNERELIVAIAELNYLYDVACYKQQRMCMMSEQFNCFF